MHRTLHGVIAVLGLLCVWQSVAEAQSAPAGTGEREIRIAAGGGVQGSDTTFSSTFSFDRYLERAVVSTDYRTRNAPIADVSGGVGLGHHLALQVGVSVATKSSAASVHASVPHPFLFNEPRTTDLAIDSVTHREIAARLEIAWAVAITSRLQVALSAGPAYIHVSQEFATGVDVGETFPYSSITIAPTTTTRHDWGVGATAAADLEWRVTPRVGLGLTGRYAHADVDLGEASLDAGGPSAIGTIRIRLR